MLQKTLNEKSATFLEVCDMPDLKHHTHETKENNIDGNFYI